MLNQRLEAAKAVAAELFPAELDLDNAILRASRLTIAVVEGRRSAKLSITAGQSGLNLVALASLKLIEARAAMGAAHLAFRETQMEIGLRAVGLGDLWECPQASADIGYLGDVAKAA